jgi:hypothetical protein
MITIGLSLTVFSKLSLLSSIVATRASQKKLSVPFDNHADRSFRALAQRPAALRLAGRGARSWLDARAAAEPLAGADRRTSTSRACSTARPTRSCARSIVSAYIGTASVTFQSRRVALYEQALARLSDTYPCGCSRREIADSAVSLAADGAQVYPGTCRAGMPAGKTARAVRVRVAGTVVLRDRVQGRTQPGLGTRGR